MKTEYNTIDWDVVEEFILKYKPKTVSIGMAQDWYWTAMTVWENGKWKELKRLTKASHWATPSIEGEFEDGTIRRESCSKIASQEELDVIDQERKEFREEIKSFAANITPTP